TGVQTCALPIWVEDGQMTGMSGALDAYYNEAKQAALGRVNYDYKGRYIAEVQFRYDGSSRFAKGNQWGFFPSGSAAWRLSEEPFFQSDRKSTRLNSSHVKISYAVFCLKKKKKNK